jgi:hypothetical protein
MSSFTSLHGLLHDQGPSSYKHLLVTVLLLTKDAADFFMISCEDATCFCAAALIEDALTIQGFSPFFTSTFTYVIEDILLRISRIFPEIIPESG